MAEELDMMRAAPIIVLLLIATIVTGLPACDTLDKSVVADTLTNLVGEWQLTRLANQDVASLLPEDAQRPSLTVRDDGSISAFGGVNRLRTTLDLGKLANGTFAVSEIAATRMAGPPEAMAIENKFIDGLQDASRLAIDGSHMTLSAGDTRLMEFRRRLVRGGS